MTSREWLIYTPERWGEERLRDRLVNLVEEGIVFEAISSKDGNVGLKVRWDFNLNNL